MKVSVATASVMDSGQWGGNRTTRGWWFVVFFISNRECKCLVSTEKEEIQIITFIRCLIFLLNLQKTEPHCPLNSTDTRDLTAQKGRLHAVQFSPYQTKDNHHYLCQTYVFTYVAGRNSVCLYIVRCAHSKLQIVPHFIRSLSYRAACWEQQDCENGTERSRPKVYPSHMGWTVDAGVVRADLNSLSWETGKHQDFSAKSSKLFSWGWR